MNFDSLSEQMDTARQRTADLQNEAAEQPGQTTLFQETFAELRASLEELRVAEAELRQQNEELDSAQILLETERRRYQALFDFAPDPYLVTDMQGVISEANTAAANLLGVNARFLKGKPIASFVAQSARGAFRQHLVGLTGADVASSLSVTLLPRRGEPVAAEARITRAFSTSEKASPNLLWVVRDLTERLAAEQARLALAEAEQREQNQRAQALLLETLLTTAPAGFALVNREGRFLQANEALTQMLGAAPDSLPSQTLAEVLGDANWQKGLPLFQQAAEGQTTPAVEMMCAHPDGSTRHLQVSHYAVRASETMLGIGLIVSDISGRKAAEVALQSAYDREHRIAEVLQRSLLRSVPDNAFSGLSVAAFYEAALAEAQIGGDFFDAFNLDGDLVALVVGDVSGKGLAAAASTAEIKYALRAFARDSLDPQVTLARLNDFMCEARQQGDWDANVFAVLSLLIINPATGQGHLALAGAEPTLVRRASGEIEAVEMHGLLLGIEPFHEYEQAEIMLEMGDTLLMVTDGITEARQGPKFFGLDGLTDLLRQAAPWSSSQEIGEMVLRGAQRFAAEPGGTGSLRDDACILVAQRQSV